MRKSLASSAASANIYQCKHPDGTTEFRDTACSGLAVNTVGAIRSFNIVKAIPTPKPTTPAPKQAPKLTKKA